MKLSRRTDTWTLPPAVTRLVVLGDPHGDLAGLEQVVVAEQGPTTAFVSVGDNVGYADGPQSSRFLARLAELGVRSVYGNHEDWATLDGRLFLVEPRGADRQLSPAAIAWCEALPARLDVVFASAPGWRVRVAHTDLGKGVEPEWPFMNDALVASFPADEGVDLVLFGHSHGAAIYRIDAAGAVTSTRLSLTGAERQAVRLDFGASFAVDAGSLGRPGYHPHPTRRGLGTYAVVDAVGRTVMLVAIDKVG